MKAITLTVLCHVKHIQQVEHNANHPSKHPKRLPPDAYSTIISFRLVRQCFKSTLLILSEIHFNYLVQQIGLINYSHPSVVKEPPFSHCPPHLQYMLHGSRFLKQVHDVQIRLVDLHEQRIFRSISGGA